MRNRNIQTSEAKFGTYLHSGFRSFHNYDYFNIFSLWYSIFFTVLIVGGIWIFFKNKDKLIYVVPIFIGYKNTFVYSL